tara:strand:+ start:391 stop:588 length:198 start_codon:yes stop_codon:yes gene_type:complete
VPFSWPPTCPDCGTDLADACSEVTELNDVECLGCHKMVELEWDYTLDDDCNEYWGIYGIGGTYAK